MSHVGPDQGTDAGGVDVGDVGEIEDQGLGLVGAYFGLEVEQVADDDGAGETEDPLSFFWAGEVFDDEGALEASPDVKAWGAVELLKEC